MAKERKFDRIQERSKVGDVVRGAYLGGNERVQYFSDFEDGAGQIDTVRWIIPGEKIEDRVYIVEIEDGKISKIGKGRAADCYDQGEFFDKRKNTLEGTF